MFYKTARRVVIAVVGSTVVLIGVALIVLPGPAVVVIPAGLAILGVEFAWAGRLLKTVKRQGKEAFQGAGPWLARLLKSVKRQAYKILRPGYAYESPTPPATKEDTPASSTPQ